MHPCNREPCVVDQGGAGIIAIMPTGTAIASIIVPTYREADNLRPLVERTFAALADAGIEAELIVVDDDSRDGIQVIAESLGREFPVRLIVRRDERGLSSAVLTGFRQARGDCFVVMDADLQHPPEAIPHLLARLEDPKIDFVLGTRYAKGGSIEGSWSWWRRLISGVATLLARPLAPLSDPMSGFFAIRRQTWEQAAALDPVGYKIALELYVKGRCSCAAEVPIHFATRVAGQSKLNLAEQLRYVRHLGRLYRFRFPLLVVVAGVTSLLAFAGIVWRALGGPWP